MTHSVVHSGRDERTRAPWMNRSAEPTPSTPPNVGPALWWSWFGWVTVGGCVGFALPAAVAAAAGHASAAVSFASLLLAGAVGGAMLGWAQAHVLRRVLPTLPTGRWVGVTSAAAVLAWLIGLVPATFGERIGRIGRWPLMAWLPLAVLGGVVLLASIGTAQWTVLRRHLPHAGGWIWGTAVAWIGALGVSTAVTTPLWAPGQSTAVVSAIGVLGGMLMAATMAAVTGVVLLHLLPIQRR